MPIITNKGSILNNINNNIKYIGKEVSGNRINRCMQFVKDLCETL